MTYFRAVGQKAEHIVLVHGEAKSAEAWPGQLVRKPKHKYWSRNRGTPLRFLEQSSRFLIIFARPYKR